MRALSLVIFAASSAVAGAACFSERWTQGLQQMCAQEGDRSAYLDMLIRQRKEFLPYLAARMEDIVQKRMSLAQASAMVLTYAEDRYPWFAEKVDLCQPGPTLHYKFACNIVLGFSMERRYTSSCWDDPAFRTRMRTELAEMEKP